jgi:hypothetical protein
VQHALDRPEITTKICEKKLTEIGYSDKLAVDTTTMVIFIIIIIIIIIRSFKIWSDCLDWIHLAYDKNAQFLITVMNVRVL